MRGKWLWLLAVMVFALMLSAMPVEAQLVARAAVATLAPGVPVQHSTTLTWSEAGTAADFYVYRSGTSGSYGASAYMGHTGSGTVMTFVDTNVSAGNTYYYVVTAVSTLGDESGYSNEVKAVFAPAPSPPTGLAGVTK